MSSLFPAYAQHNAGAVIDVPVSSPPMDTLEAVVGARDMSPAREAQLLASDEEPAEAAPAADPAPEPTLREEFYLDPKSDYGNLRVSTLYYPGRPQYARGGDEATLGRGAAATTRRARKRRRYFEAAVEPPRCDDELAARQAAFRRMLADAPQDPDLWLRFIRFQERCAGGPAALETAARGAARVSYSRALRAAHLRLARAHLPPDAFLTLLRDRIAEEKSPAASGELWVRLLDALARSPAACSAHALAAAARAAVAKAPASAYPHIVYAYGSFLRAAGLWELLVLLVELVASMSFPPVDAFPPPRDAARDAEAEARLLRLEDEVGRSGLPLSARWVRVERARAQAHWRAPAALAAPDLAADPQRAPAPADLADLLRPAAGADSALLLAVGLLRLAKVPLLPSCGALRAALGGPGGAGGAGAGDAGGEALLALLRAARRLPPAHPAHPARASPRAPARLLALLVDPPHYFSDDTGYLSWVTALWTACCAWTGGERREALLCWWLRWLHALALLADPQEEHGRAELRRLRGAARAALRAWGGAALGFAQFARLELACAGAAPAARAAAHALRAALRDPAAPHHHRLYVARVAAEIPGPESPGLWGVACAALGRPLPPDERLRDPPPADLLRDALAQVERRCDEIEAELDTDADADEERAGGVVVRALLPTRGEWAAARALLAPPCAALRLLRRACAAPPRADACWRALQYREQEACALVLAARRLHALPRYAAALAPAFPDCAFLALACSGTAAGAGAAEAAERRQTECGALADLLPPMLRAVAAWESESAGPAAAAASRGALRAARRAARGGGGALARAALLEAAARAPAPDLPPAAALLPALDDYPAHKWLYVRGAAWCGGEGAALADALLDKQLRLHALPDELDAAAELADAADADPRPQPD